MQLFGFRNPFVQRLLRELVANVGGVAERSSSSSDMCNGAMQLEHEMQVQDSHVYPDLLPYLGKRQSTGKRSAKTRNSIRSISREGRAKRICSQELAYQEDGTSEHVAHTPIKRSETSANSSIPTTPGFEKNGITIIFNPSLRNHKGIEHPGMPSLPGKTSIIAERNRSSQATDELPMELDDVEQSIDKHVIHFEQGKLAPDNEESPCNMKDELVSVKPLLTTSRSCQGNVEGTNLLQKNISKNLEFTSQHKFAMTDEMRYSVTCTQDDDTLCKAVIKESLSEIGSSSGSSNASIEKMDLYSAGQELAKSMMTFLLPRALPLLKKTYERRPRSRSRETSRTVSTLQRSGGQNDDIGLCCRDIQAADLPVLHSENDLQNEVDGSNKLPGMDSPCLGIIAEPLGCMALDPLTDTRTIKDVKSMAPDSFEDELLIHDVALNKLSSSPARSTCASSAELKYSMTNPELHIDNTEEDRDGCYLRHDVFNEAIMLAKGVKQSNSILSDRTCDLDAHNHTEEEEHKVGYMTGNQIVNIPPLGHASFMLCISQQSKGEPSHNVGERDLGSGCLKGKIPFRNAEAEFFRQASSVCYDNNKKFKEDCILKASVIPEEVVSGSPEKRLQSTCDLVNSDSNAILDSIDAGVRSQVGGFEDPLLRLQGEAYTSRKANSSDGYILKATHSTVENLLDCKTEVKVPPSQSSSIPLSESIICRNYNQTDVPKPCFNPMINAAENVQSGPTNNVLNKPPFLKEAMLNNQTSLLSSVGNVRGSEESVLAAALDGGTENDHDDTGNPVEEILVCSENKLPQPSTGPNDNVSSSQNWFHHGIHLDGSSSKAMKLDEEFPEYMKLAGCYLHPTSVLSIFLSAEGYHLKIGVICGLPESADRNLLVYMVPLQEQGIGPSFLGYTSLHFPLLKCLQQASFEGSGVQFTPDGQCLILLDSVQAPHCREQNSSCSWSKCTRGYYDENTIEIVHLEYGYVSLVAKLVVMENMSGILVCGQSYLVATGESGRLHVWIMNPTWSSKLEEFNMPGFDYLSPGVLELKILPSCTSIVIGHNGVGEFGLWYVALHLKSLLFFNIALCIKFINLTTCLTCASARILLSLYHFTYLANITYIS
ncbi:putative transforming growth factor beta regulator 1 [Dioscorea sansibarensis]